MFDEPGFPRRDKSDDTVLALHHYVYCSRAAAAVDDIEVGRIVESFQRNNRERGITGVMVFGSGVFFQWIEGPTAQIQKLIGILYSDPRHHDIVPLDQGKELRERLYPHWEMEQVGAEDICAVLRDALESVEDENSVAALKRILEHFASGSLESLGRS